MQLNRENRSKKGNASHGQFSYENGGKGGFKGSFKGGFKGGSSKAETPKHLTAAPVWKTTNIF
jgi:hypothetical protein